LKKKKKEQYNYDNLFKEKKKEQINLYDEKEDKNVSLIEYKESIISKILNKIKTFFGRK